MTQAILPSNALFHHIYYHPHLQVKVQDQIKSLISDIYSKRPGFVVDNLNIFLLKGSQHKS